jgi:cytochrome P450
LYPPVIVRQALADDLVGNTRVPAGSLVLIAPWILHRHHRSWNAPEVFDPTRFLPGAPAPEHFTCLPFGAGQRVCIGAQFALAELTLLLAIMILTFTVRLAEPRIARPTGIVSTQPENPAPFLLHRR